MRADVTWKADAVSGVVGAGGSLRRRGEASGRSADNQMRSLYQWVAGGSF